jgi:hypothetical protein
MPETWGLSIIDNSTGPAEAGVIAMTFAYLALGTLTVSLSMIALGWVLDRTARRARVLRVGVGRVGFTGARPNNARTAGLSATCLH